MKIAYFDCFSGAAGDMIVGACLDAGADWERFRRQVESLGLEEVSLRLEKVRRAGIAASLFTPVIAPHDHTHHHGHGHHGHHRPLPAILEIIARAGLSERVKEQASAIFTRLGQAEARVHDIPVEQVHFHEVGAADAIVDIVGACVALELLEVEAVFCSPPAVGSGTVRCAHGLLPVPAPATAELIKGIPVTSGETAGELLTPTGAAILTTLARSFGPMPALTLLASGCGAGQRQVETIPNIVRLLIGQTEGAACGHLEAATVLVTSIDDASGQLIGHVTGQLLGAGALDVYCTAIGMKKNRPGVEITVICQPDRVAALERILFAESTTLGIRRMACQRVTLAREWVTVETRYGAIRIKTGRGSDGVRLNGAPEYDDCLAAAQRHQAPLKEVMAAALAALERSGQP